MRRLTRGRWRRLRTVDGEHGGIAVATALLVPLFLGALALAVDTTAVWAARQQVLNGADAAVLAVAMDCARGNCGDIKATSESYFFANDEAAKLADLKAGSGWMYVQDRQMRATSTWTVRHYFGAALDLPTVQLSVESTAAWSPVARGTSDVAFAVSWCTYRTATTNGGQTTIPLTTSVTGSCAGPKDGTVTGGNAWTATTSGTACGTTATVQTTVTVAPQPTGCSAAYLNALAGTTIDLPVWDLVSGSGGTQTYRVYGWASFKVTSVANASSTSTSAPPSITGSFVLQPRQVDDTTPPATTAPDLGARAVYLTDPSTWTGPRCQNGSTAC